MAKPKQSTIKHNPPQSLDDCTFFQRLSFTLSDEQKKFRDAIYNSDNKIIFCNAKGGSGKTTVAIATAAVMVEYGLYTNIIYCFSMNNGFQNTLGLLPGSAEEKERAFYTPCEQALAECGYFPEKTIIELVPDGADDSAAFVSCKSHTFMRGTNIGNDTILIIDEAQNFYVDELKKVLTRVKDHTKVIVIGHNGQCDLIKNTNSSGFVPYLRWFEGRQGCAVCELTENFRGWVSKVADDFEFVPPKT